MLIEKIRSICQSTPDAPAVADARLTLSYGALDRRANAVAAQLLAAGVGPGSLVAVFMPRTVDALASMLGIMKAGSAYTVVEDEGVIDEHRTRLLAIGADMTLCEADRVETLREAGIAAAVAQTREREAPEGLPEPAPGDVAYVLFTSGSTGKPKGVSVTHGNVAHYTSAIADALGIDEPLNYAHVSTLAADLGNTSLFLSLATRGQLHLIDSGMRKDPKALRDHLVERRIQFIKITPTHWNAIANNLGPEGFKGLRLRYLVFGGEQLTKAFARSVFESGVADVVSNHYGPTETTVGVCAWPMRSIAEVEAIDGQSIPVGLPLGRTELRVRDAGGGYRARSAEGELFIGGPSVALGYRNQPELTEAAFLTLAGETGRFYKTGDHVRLDANGVASFLGRVDRQVKVNGYRVELEHIESALRAVPGIEEGGVFYPDTNGKRKLVAAVLMRSTDIDVDRLRKALESSLPDYMVPRVFIPLDVFPRNANGKVDMKALEAVVLERLAVIEAPAHAEDETAAASPLHREIRTLWRKYIRVGSFSNDESFFDLGGDSIDAIELIADLQLRGYQANAHGFLAKPTIDGLVDVCLRAKSAPASDSGIADQDRQRLLSPAQSFFLRHRLASADLHNQAVLLRADRKVDAELMHSAVTRLFADHPQLRTAYVRDGDDYQPRLVEAEPEDAYEVVFLRKLLDEESRRRRVEEIAQATHGSMSLERGALFKVRLIKCEGSTDLLLLVAHHIAVDMVSWRILVSELSRHYADLAEGRDIAERVPTTVFQDWVAHVDARWTELVERGGEWMRKAISTASVPPPYDPSNTEGAALTFWMGYSQAHTRELVKGLQENTGLHLHQAIMGAFAHCYARRTGRPQVEIEIESHGRLTFDDSLDISRTVGWHTSTYPISIRCADDIRDSLAAATASGDVPDLGIAFGVREKMCSTHSDRSRVSADICYNYLGHIHFSHDERFGLHPVSHSIGRARGADNHRGHAIKLSGRIIDDRLVLDLSCPAKPGEGQLDSETINRIMEEMDRELRTLADVPVGARGADILIEPGTRTGVLSYVPKALVDAVESTQRGYRHVLFTGATGYVGAHVVRELVLRSDATVHCIVRPKEGADAKQRLRETMTHYFPDEVGLFFDGRVVAIEGDAAADRFGMDEQDYLRLFESVDAVYHFAADTRLFGREEEFERQNLFSVRQCIEFASGRKRKDLHYMSTLAVCGVNPRSEVYEFTEQCGDFGQEFQNHYESSKYRAEELVQRFRKEGGQGFIYRSGNVSGHSRTARFQRNARDNRFVQFLTACVKAGQLPRNFDEPIVLSPIDEVAAGIAAISLDSAVDGGVFHVDSMHEIRLRDVFEALRAAGIDFEASEHSDFYALFSSLCDRRSGEERDPELSLGLFWAMRKQRNVRYNNKATHALMSRMRCSFTRLDPEWISRFVSGLADAGVFGRPATARFHSPAANVQQITQVF